MPFEISAGAIIFRREGDEIYYLLLHYPAAFHGKKGHWDFAKGHIEKEESEMTTIKREIREETGIKDVFFSKGFRGEIHYFFKRTYGLSKKEKEKAPWVFKKVIFYLAETKEKRVILSKEHDGFLWLPFKEAFKKITYKNSKELLEKANDFLISRKGLSNSKKNS